jgi:hypothetical protein
LIMHLPELALFSGAMGGFSGFGRQFMRRDRCVQNCIANFSAVHVLLHNLGKRLTDVSATVRSLVIREINQSQPRSILAPDRVVPQVNFNVANDRFRGARR